MIQFPRHLPALKKSILVIDGGGFCTGHEPTNVLRFGANKPMHTLLTYEVAAGRWSKYMLVKGYMSIRKLYMELCA